MRSEGIATGFVPRLAQRNEPRLFYRPDLSAPWEAPDPIPEIYRADDWKDKDPSLTY